MRKLVVWCLLGLAPAFALAQETDAELLKKLEAKAKAYAPKFPKALEFDESKWKTTKDFPHIGDPAAKKGGMLTQVWAAYVPNLRTDGPQTNLYQQSVVYGMVYESLLSQHPETLEMIPSLASHWQREVVEKDGKADHEIFRFRIDPAARWADGSEVTADDVHATWWHKVQVDRKDPSNPLVYNQFHEPKVIDKHTIEVRTKKLNWRLFLYFSGTKIFPAKYIRVPGADYLKAYQWKLMMGSGPYHVASAKDIVAQESFKLTRRADWWGAKNRKNVGLYNFDELKWIVVRDRTLQFEKMKKGELDYYVVGKAQRWAEECEFDKVQKGWILKRKIYTQNPQGFGGFAFNMRKAPFDDKRVRQAFAHLFNRKKLIEKLFFGQYEHIDSYFPGGKWASRKLPKVRYDPSLADQLLKDAGWGTRDANGIRVHDKTKKPFKITLRYGYAIYKRIWTVVRQDYLKNGIDITLEQIDPRTLYKQIQERRFDIHYQSWTGLLYPNPRTSFHSSLADQKNNNNVPGFKSPRVDKLLERYDTLLGYDAATWRKRVLVIRKIDELIFKEYPYALGWGSNFDRILYMNKFGHPKTYYSKLGDYSDIQSMWWHEPAKEAALKKAMADGTTLERGVEVQKPFADTDGKEPEGDK